MATLVQQVSALAVRMATEFKSVYGKQGNLASLSTTDKANLVAAINEIKLGLAGAGAPIDDVNAGTGTTYSSAKINSAIASAVGSKAAINDTGTSTTAVWSSSKTSAEITSKVNAKPSINDTAASATTVYSANKTVETVNAAVAALIGGAPGAMDTLKELADLISSNQGGIAAINESLGNRLRVDAAQTLTAAQRQFGRDNLDVYSRAEIGNPDTDLVAAFNSALA